MHEYRLSKYDPQYRINDAYIRDEWTSFSDVGRVYDGRVFTMEDYERAEQQHIDFLCILAEREGVSSMRIEAFESGGHHLRWRDAQLISRDDLPSLIRDVLREKCWCRLTAPSFFIHFGYEYNMYVGCSFTPEAIVPFAAEYALFAEPMRSPYHPEADTSDIPDDLRPMTAIYLTRGDHILLLYRMGSRVVSNSYTGAAGGHMEPEEITSARACVLRELREETGLTHEALEGLAMRYVTLRLKNGEIRQNFYFFAGLRDGFEPKSSNEGRLEWHSIDQLGELPMPVTAKQVLQHYGLEGRMTKLLYGGVSTAEGAVFTPMTEF